MKRNEQLTEQTSLIALQELVAAIVHTEMRQAHVQLRYDLCEDRQREAELFFERLRSYLDRLAGLLVASVRCSSIIRHLVYASLSKDHGTRFAKAVYDDAIEHSHNDHPHMHMIMQGTGMDRETRCARPIVFHTQDFAYMRELGRLYSEYGLQRFLTETFWELDICDEIHHETLQFGLLEKD